MKIKDLDQFKLQKGRCLKLKIGPFSVSVTSEFQSVYDEIYRIYHNFEALPENSLVDFEISLRHSKSLLRRVIRPQCFFSLGSTQPFTPINAQQAYPMFEWGLNWCISTHCHQYLIIHAAVIEKNGVCVILPAPPGSGKSTLTALLVYSGWRLLSDELTLIETETGLIQPLARPINLKNQSIKVVKNAFPNAVHSDVVKDTHKGDVCLFKAPQFSVDNISKKARATHVVLPKYIHNSSLDISDLKQEEVFFSLIENAFNYNILGESGFNTLTDAVSRISGYSLKYSDNKKVINWFEGLLNE